jgi:hypothetical protein
MIFADRRSITEEDRSSSFVIAPVVVVAAAADDDVMPSQGLCAVAGRFLGGSSK